MSYITKNNVKLFCETAFCKICFYVINIDTFIQTLDKLFTILIVYNIVCFAAFSLSFSVCLSASFVNIPSLLWTVCPCYIAKKKRIYYNLTEQILCTMRSKEGRGEGEGGRFYLLQVCHLSPPPQNFIPAVMNI